MSNTLFQLEIEFDTDQVWQALEKSHISEYVGIDGNGAPGTTFWSCMDSHMFEFSEQHPECVFKLIITPEGRNWPLLKFYQAGKRIANPNGGK